MEIFLIRLLQFVLAISLLVFLHECGHLVFSKLFGVRVEKFFIFMDLGLGKWSGKLFHWKPRKSDTEYGMGWLPLGGYCKIAGMIDESFDKEQMKRPAQPWEFRSKPAWQRLLIMTAGVLVNFVLAFVIYSMVLFHWGESYVPTRDMTMGMKFNEEAKVLGLQDHDILLGTDIAPFREYNVDVFRDLTRATRLDIIRDGQKMSLPLPGELNLLSMLKTAPPFMRPFVPADIDSVLPHTPAAEIGLCKGDRVLAVGGKQVDSWNEFQDVMGRKADLMTEAKTRADSLRVRQTTLVWQHVGAATPDTARVTLTEDLTFGFSMTSILSYYKPVQRDYTFWESIPAGIGYGYDVLAGYVGDLKYIFTADGAKNLGGFGAIGSLFPPTWDWHMFWLMTAFLSIILAFMNILPIPALDGGHVLFLLYELITRRKPSENFLIRAEYVGLSLLILLMVVANMNDILRWIGVL